MQSDHSDDVQGDETKSAGFYERLVALPVVTEAINQTTAVYNTVKSKHPLAEYACSTGENVVKRVADTAYSVGTPIADVALKAAKPLVGDPGMFNL